MAFPPMLTTDNLGALANSFYGANIPDDQWSDVVPPRSALTFAVVYDPEQDFMAFSDANILGFNSKQSSQYILAPHDAFLSRGATPRIHSCASEYFDASETPIEEVGNYTMEHKSVSGQTQTSSTLGGLDVYLRGASLAQTHRRQPIYSILLEFDADFHFDVKELGTTSMYQIYLARRDLNLTNQSFSWTAIDAPTSPGAKQSNLPRTSSRNRLRKRRPEAPQTGRMPSESPLRFAFAIAPLGLLKQCLSWRRAGVNDWVWV